MLHTIPDGKPNSNENKAPPRKTSTSPAYCFLQDSSFERKVEGTGQSHRNWKSPASLSLVVTCNHISLGDQSWSSAMHGTSSHARTHGTQDIKVSRFSGDSMVPAMATSPKAATGCASALWCRVGPGCILSCSQPLNPHKQDVSCRVGCGKCFQMKDVQDI